MGQARSNFGEEMKVYLEEMEVGDLIRHTDDRLDQFYVVVDHTFDSKVKVRHIESGWVHLLDPTTQSNMKQWEVVASR